MKYFGLQTRRSYRVAGFVVCLLSLISMFGIQTLVTVPAAARSGKVQKLTTSNKQTMLARMIELDRMITELKGQVAANPKDKTLVGQLINAISEYDDLSAQLGGDRAPAQPAGEAGAQTPNSPATAPVPPPGCTATTTPFTNSTPVAIPDLTTVSSTIVVAGAPTYLLDLDLTTFITHTFAADLDITLTSPAGTVVTITTDNGGGGVNVFNGTVWDDNAGTANPPGPVTDNAFVSGVVETPLVPEEAMGAFIGEDPNGTWTLTITDDAGGDTGTLNSWSLNIVTSLCGAACTITCPANITKSNDPNQCGAVVTYPAPTTTGTCGTVTCSPASGSFFPRGTTTVTCTGSSGGNCTFTVTVNDTQPPTITCPANVTAVTDQNCVAGACQTVNFPPPVATDNCPGVTVVCNPPAGSCFPVGTTTVTCTATDASGNTATCSFTISTFDVALQDDSNPSIILLWNSLTGAYRFCCNGITFTGVGKATRQGCVYTLETANAPDRRVLGRVDKAVHAGTASLQAPPGTTKCVITDRNTLNDTNLAACQ